MVLNHCLSVSGSSVIPLQNTLQPMILQKLHICIWHFHYWQHSGFPSLLDVECNISELWTAPSTKSVYARMWLTSKTDQQTYLVVFSVCHILHCPHSESAAVQVWRRFFVWAVILLFWLHPEVQRKEQRRIALFCTPIISFWRHQGELLMRDT